MEAERDQRRVLTCTGGAQDKMVISKMMQRFRPIAPKPVTGGSLNYEAIEDKKRFTGRYRRTKRKYVRVRKNNNKDSEKDKGKKTKEASTTDVEIKDSDYDNSRNIATLQLLPEKDEETAFGVTGGEIKSVTGGDDRCTDHLASLTNSLSEEEYDDDLIVGLTLSDRNRTVVESWVTVECVTGTCTDDELAHRLGGTAAERVRLLEVDTCPGLVSDGSNRVTWVNGAYRRMMGVRVGDSVRVWLVVKEDIRREMMTLACMGFGELYGAVTCRVRIQYETATWRKETKRPAAVKMMTVPCDVWRTGIGWFAWRLDFESALCLSR